MRARHALAGLLLAGPAALAFFSGGYFDKPRLIAAIAACVLLAATALVAPAPLPRRRAGRLAIIALAALAVLQAVSATWAPLRGPALDDAGRTLLYLAVLVASAALLRGRAARLAEPALLGGIVLVVLYGISERLVPGLIEFSRSRSAFGRLEQPLSYWNAMGALAALGLVLALRVAGDVRRPRGLRAAGAAVAPVLGAGVLLAFSRGALLAAAAGVLVLALLAGAGMRALAPGLAAAVLAGVAAALLRPVRTLAGSDDDRALQGAVMLGVLAALGAAAALLTARAPAGDAQRARRLGPVAIAGLAVLVAGLVVLGASLEGGAAREPEDGATAVRLASTDSNRFEYWGVALRAFADHPMGGLGSGGFRAEWLQERTIGDRVRDAHSLWVETAAELGIAGLLLVLALAFGVAMSARRALARDRALAAGPVAVLVAWGLHAAIDWDWEMPGLTLVPVILAGMLIAASEDEDETHRGSPWPVRLGVAAVSLALCLPLAFQLAQAVLVDRAIARVAAPGSGAAALAASRADLDRAQGLTFDLDPTFYEGVMLLDGGRAGECRARAERVVRAEPRNQSAWKLLAACARADDPARAAAALRRATELTTPRP